MTNHKLIRDLAEAREGSLQLDCKIWTVLGNDPALGRVMWGPDGQYIATEHDEFVPEYTTSLDAKLPWENIKDVRHNGWGWVAAHYGANGKRYEGEAHTEPLARRLAALKAKL